MDRSGRIKMLEQMLSAEPGDLFLNYALGLEYSGDLNKLADAESQFRIALSIDPKYLAAYYQLGQLFEKLQRQEEALEFYRKGLVLARESSDLKSAVEFEEALFLLED